MPSRRAPLPKFALAVLVVTAAAVAALTGYRDDRDRAVDAVTSWSADWSSVVDTHRVIRSVQESRPVPPAPPRSVFTSPDQPPGQRGPVRDAPKTSDPTPPVSGSPYTVDDETLARLESSALRTFTQNHPGWDIAISHDMVMVSPSSPAGRMDPGQFAAILTLVLIPGALALSVVVRWALGARRERTSADWTGAQDGHAGADTDD